MRLLQYVPPAIASVGGAMYGIDTGLSLMQINRDSRECAHLDQALSQLLSATNLGPHICLVLAAAIRLL